MDFSTDYNSTVSTVSVKATFEDQSTRFGLPVCSFEALTSELKRSFQSFRGSIFYLDDEGDFVVLSSETELRHALKLTPYLRLVLSKRSCSPAKYYLNPWLKKQDPENAAALQPVIISLINQGIKRHCIKRNLDVLKENVDDISKIADILREKPRADLKRKNTDNEEDNSDNCDRKRKRPKLSPEDKIARKEAKKAEKEARKNEKKDKKSDEKSESGSCDTASETSANDKEKRKREKRERKVGKKAERRGRKDKKQAKTSQNVYPAGQTHDLSTDFRALALQAYPADCEENLRAKNYTQIFLDGNNMLFVKKVLRDLTLSPRRAQAEKILATAALSFAQLLGTSVEIIFDSTNLPRGDENSPLNFDGTLPPVGSRVVLPSGTSFLLSSAQPHFSTSDDKLISWARFNRSSEGNSKLDGESVLGTTNGPNPNIKVLVVSSDRALAGELNSLGVAMMTPKKWFSFFEKLLTEAGSVKIGTSSAKYEEDVFGDWCGSKFPELLPKLGVIRQTHSQ